MADETEVEDAVEPIGDDTEAEPVDTELEPEKPTEPAADPDAPFLDLAREMGYDPDYPGDEEHPKVSAREFVKNTVVISNKQKRTIDKLQRTIDDTRSDVRKTLKIQHEVSRREIENLKTQLEEAKNTAILDADPAEVKKIDEQIETLHQRERELPEKQEEENAYAPEDDPVYAAFQERNPWYTVDSELTDYADYVGKMYANSTEGKRKPFEDILKHVEGKVQIMVNAKKAPRPAPVKPAGGNNSTPVAPSSRKGGDSNKLKHTVNELTKIDLSVMNAGLEDGTFKNEQEFLDLYPWKE